VPPRRCDIRLRGRLLRQGLVVLLCAAGAALAQAGEDLYTQAQRQSQAGDARAALASLERLRAEQPAHRDAALLQVYLLADTQAFEAAGARAERLVRERPDDAGAWLAAAYAWRHGGDAARALGAYQRAAELEPTNHDARIGQVLMLRATGAAEQALALALQTPGELPAGVLDGLRQDAAAYLIRDARDAPGTPAERSARFERAETLLRSIANPGPGVQADLVALAAARGEPARALAQYDAAFEAQTAPRWATQAAASSCLALRQPARALQMFEALLAADPRDAAAQRGRFYALADLGRFEDAQQSADGLAGYLARAGDVAGARSAQVLRAYARAWAGEYASGRRILDDALRQAPQDNELQAALARVLAWAQLPAQARAQFERVLAADPEHADARTGLAALAQQTEDLAESRQRVNELVAALGETESSVRELVRAQRALEGPWVWSEWRNTTERGADMQGLQLEAGSGVLGAHNLRLLAGVARNRYAGSAGTFAETRSSVGMQAGTHASGVRVRVHRFSRDARTAAEVAWSGDVTPAWRLEARLATGSDAVAAAARLAGVSATTFGLDVRYRADVAWQAWGSAQYSHLSDGNVATQASAGGSRTWDAGGGRRWELAASAGAGRARADPVAYFNPRQSWWVEVQPAAAGQSRVSHGTQSMSWRAGPLAGLYGQYGQRVLPYLGASAELSWDVHRAVSLGLNASSVRRPYDGVYVVQHSLALSVFARLP